MGMSESRRQHFLNEAFLKAWGDSVSSIREREIDGEFYHTHSPLSDQNALSQGRNPNDIPKLNTVKRNIDWVVGYINDAETIPLVVADFGQGKAVRAMADRRLQQVRSQWQACQADRYMEAVVRDSAIFGEGVARVQMRYIGNNMHKLELRRMDWRGFLPDRENFGLGYRDARYLFSVRFVDKEDVIAEHPDKIKEIENASEFTHINQSPFAYEDYSGYWNNNYRGFGVEGAYSLSEPGREQVLYGLAWWREKEGRQMVVKSSHILIPPGKDRVVMLTPPHNPFDYAVFPYVGVIAEQDHKSLMPYSPLIRPRRGLEIFLSFTLRAIIALTTNRGAIINRDEIPMKDGIPLVSDEDFIEAQRNILADPNFVALTKNNDNYKIIENDKILAHTVALFEKLLASSEITGQPIDPSLLGQNSNINAAVAIKEKEKHAHLSISQLVKSCHYAKEDAGEFFLGYTEKFEDILVIPAFVDEDGMVEQVREIDTGTGDTLADNRFHYRISVRKPPSGYEAEMISMLNEGVKVGGPGFLPLAMLLGAELSRTGSPGFRKELASLMNKAGYQVPVERLPREEQQQVVEQRQQAQMKQQQAEALQFGQAEADIKETEAGAFQKQAQGVKALADADKSRAEAMQPQEQKVTRPSVLSGL